MYTAKIENRSGQVSVLTGRETEYQVISIEGLNPPQSQLNLTSIVGMDGAVFNSSKLETRNIVITIRINGDVEENRLALYQIFRTKEWCRFYYKNAHRDVYIDGYVESVECGLFSNSETAQISIICPSPYFKDLEEIIDDISNTVSLFTFPFFINENEPIPFSEFVIARVSNIFNNSSAETGLEIVVNVVGAFNKLVIRNTETGETLTLNYSFLEDDIIHIDTNKGQKSVKLIRDGVTLNIFSAVAAGSVFFQLRAGDNFYGYLVNDGEEYNNLAIVQFRHRTVYRGV